MCGARHLSSHGVHCNNPGRLKATRLGNRDVKPWPVLGSKKLRSKKTWISGDAVSVVKGQHPSLFALAYCHLTNDI